MGTTARLGPVPLLAAGDQVWALVEGTSPYQGSFKVRPGDADRLEGLGTQGLTLDLRTLQDNLQVRQLFFLHQVPGDHPHEREVLVTDRRWLWTYGHIGPRRYNVRRHVGFHRLKNPAAQELQPVVATVQYAPFSVHPSGRAWTALEILQDVLDAVLEIERQYNGQVAGHHIEPSLADKLTKFPVENLVVDDRADLALQRTLDHLAEAGCRLRLDGTVVLYDKASGAEQRQVRRLGHEAVGKGHTQLVTKRRVRAKRVEALFTREVEVRFDYEELDTLEGTTDVQPDDRYMENVLPVPDWELQLDTGETVCQGTYITIQQALRAWNLAVNGDNPFGQALTLQDLREAIVPYLDLAAALDLLGKTAPRADWSARLNALFQHYRRTFRLNRRWMDRVLSWDAYRVSIIDPTTGTRAPAVAYADFCWIASQRSLLLQATQDQPLNYVNNVPRDMAGDKLTSSTVPAPARVSIVDHDQGIVRVDFMVDTLRLYEMTLPGMIGLNGSAQDALGRPKDPGPVAQVGRAATRGGHQLGFNLLRRLSADRKPELVAPWKLTIIITAVPGSPNTDQQLHRIPVTPAQVAGIVPPGMRAGLGDATGPVQEVRIGGGVETARVAWLDSRSDDVERLFGLGDGKPAKLAGLVINDSGGAPAGAGGGGVAASLQGIALAAAARVYTGYADRVLGDAAGKINGQVEPEGWIGQVQHIVTRRGEGFTRLDLPDKVAELKIASLLDPNTRAVVFKLARPGKEG